jgi:hypothetical protein
VAAWLKSLVVSRPRKSFPRLLACSSMLRERDHPARPAPLDVDWMLFAACSELEVEESDRLFFCGRGQA